MANRIKGIIKKGKKLLKGVKKTRIKSTAKKLAKKVPSAKTSKEDAMRMLESEYRLWYNKKGGSRESVDKLLDLVERLHTTGTNKSDIERRRIRNRLEQDLRNKYKKGAKLKEEAKKARKAIEEKKKENGVYDGKAPRPSMQEFDYPKEKPKKEKKKRNMKQPKRKPKDSIFENGDLDGEAPAPSLKKSERSRKSRLKRRNS